MEKMARFCDFCDEMEKEHSGNELVTLVDGVLPETVRDLTYDGRTIRYVEPTITILVFDPDIGERRPAKHVCQKCVCKSRGKAKAIMWHDGREAYEAVFGKK
jgi:hypothetical protein